MNELRALDDSCVLQVCGPSDLNMSKLDVSKGGSSVESPHKGRCFPRKMHRYPGWDPGIRLELSGLSGDSRPSDAS